MTSFRVSHRKLGAELEALGKKIVAGAAEEGHEAGDLVVGEGDRVTLSSQSAAHSHAYLTVRPRSADDLREWMGTPILVDDETGATKRVSRARCMTGPTSRASLTARLGARIVSPAELESDDEAARLQATALARAAAREYVFGDAEAVEAMRPTIDAYLNIAGVELHVPVFRDITVHNHGVLVIAPDTHAVYANRIRLYGDGRIQCDGPKTIHCGSFEGMLPERVVIKKAKVTAKLRKQGG